MSHKVVTEPEADQDLERLPKPLQRSILRDLIRQAESTGTHAKPAPSYYPSGVYFDIRVPFDDMTVCVDAVFRFSQDEGTIHVLRFYVEYL